MLPMLDKYGKKNSLRPNPGKGLIDGERDNYDYVTGSVNHGDFGDDSASARRVNGLPKPLASKKDKFDEIDKA